MNVVLHSLWLALLWPAVCLAQPASTTADTGLAVDPAQALAGDTVGAITMMPGETYRGPGPLTVGYLGAKKQLVLPNGVWVLLAAADRKSSHATPVPLVSMVFGQFREGRLMRLVDYDFNGRNPPPSTRWNEPQHCAEGRIPSGATQVVDRKGDDVACGWTQTPTAAPKVADLGWERALLAVARLGASVPAVPLQYTRAWATDGAGNVVTLRRADYEAAPLSSTASTPSTRVAWLRDYLPLMLEGLHKRLSATELEPDQPTPPRIRLQLLD